MENEIKRAIAKIEQRRNNTEKAKKEIYELMSKFELGDDVHITGSQSITMRTSYHANGTLIKYGDDENFILAIRQNKMGIYKSDNYSEEERVDLHDIDYINLQQFVKAFAEMIKLIANMEDFNNETNKIHQLLEVLS